jgi:hypothetical protein
MFRTVKKLLFFLGHARSGSTMLGRLLDAHPHMTVTHEFDVFTRWSSELDLQDKNVLFKTLYRASAEIRWRATEAWKVFPKDRLCHKLLNVVPGQWQGMCDGYLEIIGDKKASGTMRELLTHPKIIDEMNSKLHLPLMFIYPIRHPLDMISTQVLQSAGKYYNIKKTKGIFSNTTLLTMLVQSFQKRVTNIQRWMESKWLNILPVYNDDLIRDPALTLRRICAFLQITCTPEYIGNCSKLIFSSPSRTRDHVYWPSQVKQSLLDTVKQTSIISRYQNDF